MMSEMINHAVSPRTQSEQVWNFLNERLMAWNCPDDLSQISFNVVTRRKGSVTSLHLTQPSRRPIKETGYFCSVIISDKPKLREWTRSLLGAHRE